MFHCNVFHCNQSLVSYIVVPVWGVFFSSLLMLTELKAQGQQPAVSTTAIEAMVYEIIDRSETVEEILARTQKQADSLLANRDTLLWYLYQEAVLDVFSDAYLHDFEALILEQKMAVIEPIKAQSAFFTEAYFELLKSWGVHHWRKSEYGKAAAYFKRALEELNTYPELSPLNRSYFCYNLAANYDLMDMRAQAQLYYEEASSILETILKKEPNNQEAISQYSTVLNNTAYSLYEAEQLTQAIKAFERSLDFARKHRDTRMEIISIGGLQNCYTDQGDYEKSMLLLEEGAVLRRQYFGAESREYALLEIKRGELLIKLNRAAEAEAVLMERYEAWKDDDRYNRGRPYLFLLHRLALAVAHQGDFERAEGYILDAFQANSFDRFNREHPALLEQLVKLDYKQPSHVKSTFEFWADIEKIKGDEEQALRIVEAYLKYVQIQQVRLLDEADKLDMLQEGAKLSSSVLKYATKHYPERTFQIVEQQKSALVKKVLGQKKQADVYALPPEWRQRENVLRARLLSLKQQQRQALKKDKKDSLRTLWLDTERRLNTFKDSLRKTYPAYFKAQYTYKLPQLSELQEQLAEKQVLVEYIVSPDYVGALVIDKKQIRSQVLELNSTQLEDSLAVFYDMLTNYASIQNGGLPYKKAFLSMGWWMYQQLWEPLQVSTKDFKQVILIPSTRLGHIPFEALLTEPVTNVNLPYASLPYLLRQFSFTYAYSAELWSNLEARQSAQGTGKLLAFAPTYGEEAYPEEQSETLVERGLVSRKALSPLPYAEKEVEALMDLMVGKAYIGAEATETRFKREAPKYGILHLAVHGLMNAENYALSALSLNPDSLADGFLQSFEVATMNLKADLLVLSACETGFGRFAEGEGILSLARPFILAGTSSLVVSLWSVNDAATANIMLHFYEKLGKGKDKATALQQAKLAYLAKAEGLRGHPAFWAPFIQMGKTSPLKMEMKNNWPYWIWGASLLAVALSLGFWFQKRKSLAKK